MSGNGEKIYLMRPSVGEEELQAVKDVFGSKFLTEGDFTKRFETEFAKYVQVEHAVAVTSCTTALELALRVLDIGPGDEVIVPDFTHPATGNVVLSVGAKPVLVDVDIKTFNTDAEKIAKGISNKTKAIIPVSLFGNPLDMRPIIELKEKHGFVIIEDAACTIGAEIDGKKVGGQADITCFSLHPRKIITTGEGGMLVTNDDELAAKARAFKNFGFVVKNSKMVDIYAGSNYKFSNILAAIGLVQLSKIERILSSRIKAAEYYTKLLAGIDDVNPPHVSKNTRHTFQSYCVYLKKKGIRDALKQHLLQKNIEAQIGTYALHLEPAYNGIKHTDITNSELAYMNTLALPLHGELKREQQEYIVRSILDFMRE